MGVMLEEDTCKPRIFSLYSGCTYNRSRGTYIRGLIEKGALFGIRLLTRLVSRHPVDAHVLNKIVAGFNS